MKNHKKSNLLIWSILLSTVVIKSAHDVAWCWKLSQTWALSWTFFTFSSILASRVSCEARRESTFSRYDLPNWSIWSVTRSPSCKLMICILSCNMTITLYYISLYKTQNRNGRYTLNYFTLDQADRCYQTSLHWR